MASSTSDSRPPVTRPPDPGVSRGRVVQVLGPQWVVSVNGRTRRCVAPRSVRRGLVRPVVGDWVDVEFITPDLGRIVRVLPRRNRLRRADVHRGARAEHVIVANVDRLLVVGSVAAPGLNPGLMDRYLVAAWQDDIRPMLCFSKIDLPVSDWARSVMDAYEALEIPIVRTSTVTGAGLDTLRTLLDGGTTAFAGLSGTGKTTLVRRLPGDDSLAIGEVSRATGRGRHVTSSARLLPITGLSGSFVVDLPGQRVFGLTRLTPNDLMRGFPDLAGLGPCLLPGCRHGPEPGCALRAAVAQGRVSRRRLEVFRRIRRSLEDEGVLMVSGSPGTA